MLTLSEGGVESVAIVRMEEAVRSQAAELCEGVGVSQKVCCLYTAAAQCILILLLSHFMYNGRPASFWR